MSRRQLSLADGRAMCSSVAPPRLTSPGFQNEAGPFFRREDLSALSTRKFAWFPDELIEQVARRVRQYNTRYDDIGMLIVNRQQIAAFGSSIQSNASAATNDLNGSGLFFL